MQCEVKADLSVREITAHEGIQSFGSTLAPGPELTASIGGLFFCVTQVAAFIVRTEHALRANTVCCVCTANDHAKGMVQVL